MGHHGFGSVMKIGNGELWHGDCLELMRLIPDGSVDMVLCDLPYGTTACKWDTIIPFEPLWLEYWRVCKPNAAIVLTASQPFTSALIISQVNKFKYCWVWDKVAPGDVMNAKNKPMKQHEDVCVFSAGTTANGSNRKMNYFPIGLSENVRSEDKQNMVASSFRSPRPSHAERYKRQFTGYPRSLIQFSNADRRNAYHPTQKPVPLFDYLIRTYTNPGDLVLDNCSGSGTTAIAAQASARRWLCIEKDPVYFFASAARVLKACA